ncbi:head-tail connector protein [Lacticaseibacillus paracasei]|uniref:head-tail connector protein n=1 Tax=Lacticaseibacillus paracasei TaxID=1597 RepID=UPI0021C3F41C|nr:head-tail connector protein [Lacticaseibacillus paracasei]MCP9311335.1 head-tail connector protein [Lacticaseibacillus paracasei]MCP9348063.1 head-tail connector protein [Lacticaseibacillus paracasei]MCP9367664.1 head-tail connector protein [Lacticaseibacillus paracasei]MCP9379764.1 head-tail connector protein [Lacticaseibacillus paracasei]
MTVTTEDIKNSLRVQTDTDDTLIQNYITAAQDYVHNAVDSTAAIDKLQAYSQFDIAVAMLTEFWYQNRGAVTTASQEPPYSVVSMIQQLRGLFAADV